ncbi:MAG: UDP-N-acetylmuramate dehydrogenase [Gammaproteobacteria bacterium]|jgi:UDP-N-acetylmuramate dehydrogenase
MMAARQTSTPLRGTLRSDAPLAKLTTWRVGGPADLLFKPADLADLQAFLADLDEAMPLTWLGLGSNVLIRDGGIRGAVLLIHGALERLEQVGERRIRAEAGLPCAKVARFAARQGLTGAEFLAGIPGTMGGALAMNAGAFGTETWSRVVAVETLDRFGRLHRRTPEEFEIGYRHVASAREEWFVACELELAHGDAEASLGQIRELLARRGATQPTGVATCGSVFRNPPGDYAGRLIEACGLKGYCIGGACVSDKHGNFILNTGDATAADLERLILHVQATVEAQTGIRLEPEVRILGEANKEVSS